MAGVLVGAGELGDVIAASVRARTAESAGTAQTFDSFFHDEQLDGPPPALPMRVVVVASDVDRAMTERRLAGVTESELLLAESSDALFGGARPGSSSTSPSRLPVRLHFRCSTPCPCWRRGWTRPPRTCC